MKRFFLIVMILFMTACTPYQRDTRIKKQGFFFDTVVNITLDDKHIDAASEAFVLCNEIENTFSRTKKGSELFKLNNNETTELSPDLKELLEFSFYVSEISEGAFDVTVAPLTDLWNIKNRTTPPSDKEIRAALEKVGYKKVSLEKLDMNNCTIDLGGVAKGYAGDRIRKLLIEMGVSDAIIDLGGNAVLIGEHTVGIKNPFDKEALFARITLKDKSAATSGAYQRYFEYEGTRYHHIIDPHTGHCADSGIASVTVISPSSAVADALGTAIFIIGEGGISLCENFPETDAFIIMENGEVLVTDGFDKRYSTEYFVKK